MEDKKFELNDEELNKVAGGTDDDDGWYWGWGHPPQYLNACPVCGGGVYAVPSPLGGNEYFCGPCGWSGTEMAEGYIRNNV